MSPRWCSRRLGPPVPARRRILPRWAHLHQRRSPRSSASAYRAGEQPHARRPRRRQTHVVLDGDSVSRRYAPLLSSAPRAGWSSITGSNCNGTYFATTSRSNPAEVVLKNGDRVKVGPTIFKFLSGADVEAQYHEEIYRTDHPWMNLTPIHNKRYLCAALEREIIGRCRHGAWRSGHPPLRHRPLQAHQRCPRPPRRRLRPQGTRPHRAGPHPPRRGVRPLRRGGVRRSSSPRPRSKAPPRSPRRCARRWSEHTLRRSRPTPSGSAVDAWAPPSSRRPAMKANDASIKRADEKLYQSPRTAVAATASAPDRGSAVPLSRFRSPSPAPRATSPRSMRTAPPGPSRGARWPALEQVECPPSATAATRGPPVAQPRCFRHRARLAAVGTSGATSTASRYVDLLLPASARCVLGHGGHAGGLRGLALRPGRAPGAGARRRLRGRRRRVALLERLATLHPGPMRPRPPRPERQRRHHRRPQDRAASPPASPASSPSRAPTTGSATGRSPPAGCKPVVSPALRRSASTPACRFCALPARRSPTLDRALAADGGRPSARGDVGADARRAHPRAQRTAWCRRPSFLPR